MERTINEIIVRAMELEVEYQKNRIEAMKKVDIVFDEYEKVGCDSLSTEYEIDEAYSNLCEAEDAASAAEGKHEDILEALGYLRRTSELFSGLNL